MATSDDACKGDRRPQGSSDKFVEATATRVLKTNTDASFLGNNKLSGVGAVVRDHEDQLALRC